MFFDVIIKQKKRHYAYISVKDYTVDHDIDIFALTETWLEPGDSDRLLIEELIPSGYRFLHNPRSIGRGGGVGMLFKYSLRVKQEETIVTDSSTDHQTAVLPTSALISLVYWSVCQLLEVSS